ncbi:MAG: type I phosphomannose isomerase catalytic subunit [Candidatus Jordarchaeales archaeon]
MKIPRFLFQAKENLVEKAWGGQWIPELKGLAIPGNIGESWEFSAHPSNPSEVIVNAVKLKLPDLIAVAREEILGKLSGKYSSFPILVKLLDVRGRLSVQVHPSSEVAKELGETEPGKSEGWISLGEGRVYIGFKEDVSPDEVRKSPESVPLRLNRFNAGFLDTFMIPAGTVHFAEGARFLEVSTNSNITYRVFDFEGREVHLEKAVKAMRLTKSAEREVKGEKGRFEMPEFGVETIKVEGEAKLSTGEVFNILFSVDGEVTLKSGREKAKLRKGYSCLVPAATGSYTIEGEQATIIKVYAK